MRATIVERLSQGAAPDVVTRARAVVQSRGNLLLELVAAGFAPQAVMEACVAVTGIPAAPVAWLRSPSPPPHKLDAARCLQFQVAPIASEGGQLCVAYANPEVAVRRAELGFPAHQPYLAMPAHLERALALLSGSAPQPLAPDELAAAAEDARPALAPAMAPRRPPTTQSGPKPRPPTTAGGGIQVTRPSAAPRPPAPSAPADEDPTSNLDVAAAPGAALGAAPAAPRAAAVPQRPAEAPHPPTTSSSSLPRARPVMGPLDEDVAPGGGARPSGPTAKAPGPQAKGPQGKKEMKPVSPRKAFAAPETKDAGASPPWAAIGAAVVVVVAVLAAVLAPRAEPEAPKVAKLPEEAVVVGRQQDLVMRAGTLQDHGRAVELLTAAIEMDPRSRGARMALVERVRRHIELLDLDAARADIATLKAHPEAATVAATVEGYAKQIAALERARQGVTKGEEPAP